MVLHIYSNYGIINLAKKIVYLLYNILYNIIVNERKENKMTKKKEDLGGVWRTVGGRRIFIKDGQDLYEAMNDSGKFTNLKKTNSQRKGKKISDELKKDVKDFMKETGWNKYLNANINKYDDFNEYKKAVEKDMKSLIEESEANYDDLQYVMSYLEDKGNAYKIDANLTNKIKTMTVIGADDKIVDMNMKEIERIEDAGSYYDIKFKNGWGMKSKDKVVAINGVETKEYLASKKNNFESKSLKEQVNEMKEFMNNYRGEKLYEDFAKKTGIDEDRAVELYQDAESHGDLEIPNELQSKSAYAIKGNEWQDVPGFKDYEYNQKTDEVRTKKEVNDKWNAKKIDDFVKNNPDWEIGRYDEDEFDDLADTLGVGRSNVQEEIYDRIREKNISDHKEMFERVKKDFIEKTDKREEEYTLTSLRKADNWNDINSAIDNIKDEKLKAMMKKEAQKLEENENGAWKSADYLAREYNFYKEDFERGKNAKIKIDLNDQDKLNEISDNYENVDKYELDEISRDYILNRRKEISYNKRMNDFVERDKKFREDQERKIVSDYENGEIGYDEVLQKFNGDRSKIDEVFDRNGYISPTTKEAYNDRRTFKNIAKFYGYDKLSNEEIERTLEHAEAKGLYHSKGDIEAMRRYLGRTVIEKDTGSAYSKPGKRWEILEEGKSAFGKPIYKVMDEDGNVMWRDADTFYKKKK